MSLLDCQVTRRFNTAHPGAAFIVVTQGTLTVYDGNDPTCTPHVYGPGTGFLDPGFGHVHIARR
jgi:hypothetical protein